MLCNNIYAANLLLMPPEILCSEIVSHLSRQDIFNLSLANKLVYKRIKMQAFSADTFAETVLYVKQENQLMQTNEALQILVELRPEHWEPHIYVGDGEIQGGGRNHI